MKKFIIAGLSTLTLLGSASTTLAYRGDPNAVGPNYDPARHTAMQAAFDKGASGYADWAKLMTDRTGRIKDVVTNSTIFAEFAQARKNGTQALTTFRAKYNLGTGARQNGTGYGRNR